MCIGVIVGYTGSITCKWAPRILHLISNSLIIIRFASLLQRQVSHGWRSCMIGCNHSVMEVCWWVVMIWSTQLISRVPRIITPRQDIQTPTPAGLRIGAIRNSQSISHLFAVYQFMHTYIWMFQLYQWFMADIIYKLVITYELNNYCLPACCSKDYVTKIRRERVSGLQMFTQRLNESRMRI